MQDLNISLVQADQIWENKEANLAHYTSLLKNAEKTDLILLPEMFSTGFTMNTSLAETMDDAPSIQWLKQTANELQAAIYTSLIIEESGKHFNRGVFVTKEGHITTYDKRKTFGLAGENNYYTRGDKEVIVTLNGWKLQLQICYDLRFPEIVRNELIDGTPKYDAILYVANWPEKRALHWSSLLIARAIENQCYVLGTNRVGKDDNGLAYSGNTAFVNALGEVTSLTGEGILHANLSYSNLNEIRQKLPFLKDRHV